MDDNYLTVEALTKYIKRKFDADPYLKKVYVKGELSNVKHHSSGHIYFTLKDDKAQIKGIMYARQAAKLKFSAENGMNVLIECDVNVFEKSGSYQLYASKIEPDGLGSLFLAYEQLKETLQKEGLFDARFKQPLVPFPQMIGVITATTGAAVRDICTTIKRHYPIANIKIFPTLVQGANAAPSIVQSIRQANALGQIDTLIVGRGGGSIEDLWAFNEESVARAIFESRIPIISAVGHETDTTIADFVADFRAPTPTGAAKMAVPDVVELKQRVQSNDVRMLQATKRLLDQRKNRLEKALSSYTMVYPERMYRPFEEQLSRLEQRLEDATSRSMTDRIRDFQSLQNRLRNQMPMRKLALEQQRQKHATYQLQMNMQRMLSKKRQQFQTNIRTLNALNPLSVMERGFSIVYNNKDDVVMSVQQVATEEQITIQVVDGQIDATVLRTK
ncbi:exodeoxyribonuclease VII large subunit [Kurthia senegalensis]|uniref:exodeoxyribonuclease VII large subunit n=1 Tax=Kurthia senegalensis TaxID=1033740 RepID=UPI000289EED1|nr:exodeoxyribonuclease VII large subunit [Kurthia senegalensis]